MKLRKTLLILFSFSICLNVLSQQKSYKAEWNSLKEYKVPEWWKNMKFGIYFHWGPYSVPAYKTEWYSHYMYQKGHPIRKYHEKHYGSLSDYGYKDFINQFKAEHFDADEWVKLFKEAGAQFVGPVAEHADGFAMWNSKLTHYDSYEMGPKRDIVGEMQKAVHKYGLKFLLTYHRHWLYSWYPTWDKSTDTSNSKYQELYGPKLEKNVFNQLSTLNCKLPGKDFNQQWLARLDELIENYSPDIIWFDNRMNIIAEEYRKKFLQHFYNYGLKNNKEVVCTYKFHDLVEGTAVLDLERSRMKDKMPFPWLTDDSIDWGAWCNVSSPNYKSTNRLIDFLVDVVSKNGAVLLNVTPTADGIIPEGVQKRLKEMGEWFKVNGEAIYNTRPFVIFGEGTQRIVEGHLSEKKNPEATAEDIRFTTNEKNLYAICLDWPADGRVLVHSLSRKSTYLKQPIKDITLLGCKNKLDWKQTDKGLIINLPDEKPCNHAFSFKIICEQK